MLDTVCDTELPLWVWWRPRIPALHHTAVLTPMCIFFLECRAGCSCFIVLSRFDFYRMSLMGGKIAKICVFQLTCMQGADLGGFLTPWACLSLTDPGLHRQGNTEAVHILHLGP